MHISSRENPAVKRLVRLQKSKDFRDQMGVFVCEGMTLLEQAGGMELEAVYCLERLAGGLPPWLDCPVYTVDPGVMDKISDTKAPQGVVFTCRMPTPLPPSGRLLALEELRDPGNLGTILRTAEAFGLGGVILVGSCADIYAPKVVRGAMGSLFRMPVHTMEADQLAAYCREHGLLLTGAALTPDSLPLEQVTLENSLVVIGNEARGISDRLMALCSRRVVIPIRGVQSLNAAVAAAILMWEMSKG